MTLRVASDVISDMSDDVVRSLPDLYESAKGELKNRIDNALQDQTALDYYDILQSQTRIQTEAGKVREYVMSGDINNPTLNKIFLETPDADRFYVSEIQSDFVQKSSGGKSGEIPVRSFTIDNKKVTRKGERMELDSFQKNWRTKPFSKPYFKDVRLVRMRSYSRRTKQQIRFRDGVVLKTLRRRSRK